MKLNIITPKLRFPGFSGEWQVKKLGDVAKVTSGGTPSRTNPQYWNGDIPWITTSEIDFNSIHTAKQFISEDGVSNSAAKIFPKGSILVALYGQGKTRGKVAKLEIGATTNQACGVIIPDSKVLNNDYIFQDLVRRYDSLRNLSNDGSQKNLSGQLIKSLILHIPSPEEQQKIADFLATVDDKITTIEKKVELLKQYKKGVMQKIFTQKIRFKDENGNPYPEWKEKKLKDLADKITDSYNPVVSVNIFEDIELESLDQGNGKLLRTFPSNEQKSIKIKFSKGDVLYSKLRPYLRKYYLADFDGVATSEIWVLRAKQAVSSSYLYSLVQSDDFSCVVDIQAGSKMPRADWKTVSGTIFQIPDEEEQQKIADFLTILDDKIKAEEAKLTATKKFKKALLQRMFV